MKYTHTAIADLEQLIDHCQPNNLLCIGGKDIKYLTKNGNHTSINIGDEYCSQRQQILKPCVLNRINHKTTVADIALTKRYDLAIISCALEYGSKTNGEQLLSRLRDLCSPRTAVLINFSLSEWSPSDLLAFGLVRLDHYLSATQASNPSGPESSSKNEGEIGLYHYNIDTYKQTPDWLNSKHWANPNLWDKVWW